MKKIHVYGDDIGLLAECLKHNRIDLGQWAPGRIEELHKSVRDGDCDLYTDKSGMLLFRHKAVINFRGDLIEEPLAGNEHPSKALQRFIARLDLSNEIEMERVDSDEQKDSLTYPGIVFSRRVVKYNAVEGAEPRRPQVVSRIIAELFGTREAQPALVPSFAS